MDSYDWQIAAILDFGYWAGQTPTPHIRTIICSKQKLALDRHFVALNIVQLAHTVA